MTTKKARPMTSAEERTMRLTLQEISAVFHMPLHEACVQLQADEPTLKKRYRELGINAWPYRKRYKFDDPNIESLVRSAMTRGSKKKSPENVPAPKSPSLFGNFILATKKKTKKEELREQLEQRQAAQQQQDMDSDDSPMSETSHTPTWQERTTFDRPAYPQLQQQYGAQQSPQQWSPYTYQNTQQFQAPYYSQQYEQKVQSQSPYQHKQQSMSQYEQKPQYYPTPQPSYPRYDNAPQYGHQNALPSISEMLNTPPQFNQMPQQNTRQYTNYQTVKQESNQKVPFHAEPNRFDARQDSYGYNTTQNRW